MDMSFMTKLRVTGADAGRVLDHVSAGAVDGEAERITYTQWLDPDGKLQADLTVTKLADDDFWVVASDTAHGHVLAWLARHIGGADVTIEDVTEDWAQLNVQGPQSRDLLATLTDADLSTEAFPFRTARFDHACRGPRAARADHVRRRARLRAVPPGRRCAGRVRRAWPPPAPPPSASRRWRAAGWRRATATSGTTSTTPTT